MDWNQYLIFSVCWTVFCSCCLATWASGLGNSWMPQEITYRLGGNFWPSRASAKLHGDPLAARGRWLYPTVGLVNLNNYHQKTIGGFLKLGIPQNYFTSCDPHHDIYPFCYWQIFWHSIWHISWHSIWHSIWHIFWHFIWHICWHSIWHIFWHSVWHLIWHSLWHTFWHSIWHIF